MSARVFLGLGSNLGDRAARMKEAGRRLAAAGLEVRALSALYRTEPVGIRDQPEFLNQALEVRTGLDPERLLALCLRIETDMGRHRSRPGGPRRIDVDLLLYGDRVRAGPALTLPHPEMHRRRFVLVPLAEIAAGVRHPVLGRTVAELLRDLESAAGPLPEVVRADPGQA